MPNFKFGRRRPAPHSIPKFSLQAFATEPLPTPPASVDYSPHALPNLTNILGNDTVGDCVIASAYHALGVYTGGAGDLFTPTESQVIADYSAIGGYVPGKPETDQGCDEVAALNYWKSHGFANGDKLAGWLPIDPMDTEHVKACLNLFEAVIFCMELPSAWTNNEPSGPGFTWDVAGDPVPENGHSMMAYGYDDHGIIFDTWGLVPAKLTWAALAKYASESNGGGCYVAVTPTMVAKATGKNPAGYDWPSIVKYFDSIGGTIPAPTPTPPAPVPVPSKLVTVDTDGKAITLPQGWRVHQNGLQEVVLMPNQHVAYIPKGWTIH